MDSVFCIGNSRVVFDPLFELLVPKTAAADRAAEDNAHLSAQLGITVRRQLAAGRLLVCVRDVCCAHDGCLGVHSSGRGK